MLDIHFSPSTDLYWATWIFETWVSKSCYMLDLSFVHRYSDCSRIKLDPAHFDFLCSLYLQTGDGRSPFVYFKLNSRVMRFVKNCWFFTKFERNSIMKYPVETRNGMGSDILLLKLSFIDQNLIVFTQRVSWNRKAKENYFNFPSNPIYELITSQFWYSITYKLIYRFFRSKNRYFIPIKWI